VSPTIGHRWQTNVPPSGIWADVMGANARTYTPVAADVGHRLRCVATATNAAGSTDAYSQATDAVVAAPTPPPITVDPPSVDAPAGETSGPSVAVDAPLAVRVRTRVTRTRVERGRTIRFTGWVVHARAGTPFAIQRRADGEWRTIASGVTAGGATPYSVFSQHVRVHRTARYRVLVQSIDANYTSAAGRTIRVFTRR
jgi:hypothetical protein